MDRYLQQSVGRREDRKAVGYLVTLNGRWRYELDDEACLRPYRTLRAAVAAARDFAARTGLPADIFGVVSCAAEAAGMPAASECPRAG